MPRIFTSLAIFALLFVALTAIIGLTVGDYADLAHHVPVDPVIKNRVSLHQMLGVAAGLAVVLVNSIVVTYFVGTSRWCKEVTETYQLDSGPLVRSTKLKRRTFPWAAMSMLVAVGVVALGGAADPGARGPDSADHWVLPHLFGALGGLAFFGWSFWIQFQNILANQAVINEIMSMVQTIRHDRGLD